MKWFWLQVAVAFALMLAMVASALVGNTDAAVLYGFLALFIQNTIWPKK